MAEPYRPRFNMNAPPIFPTARQPVPLPPPRPGAFEQAVSQYPILGGLGLTPKYSYGGNDNRQLEYWPKGEPGAPNSPRPTEIPMRSGGVEIFNRNVRPIDVLGDVASHQLTETDPVISGAYQSFKQSLNEDQKKRLLEQYDYAQRNLGETRSYQDWESKSGLPAYFRGYAFEQWPQDFSERAYTPEQRTSFDQMMQYLRGQNFNGK